jgi:hypothetical protein
MKQPSRVAKATQRGIVLAGLCAIGYVGILAILRGPIATYRILTNLWPNIYTYRIFPQRAIETTRSASELKKAQGVRIPDTITFPSFGRQTTMRLSDLLTQTDTKAFIAIRNNVVITMKPIPMVRVEILSIAPSRSGHVLNLLNWN